MAGGEQDDKEPEIQTVVGRAEASEQKNAEDTVYAAVLWVPDPTERRGWRDLWIERKKVGRAKPMGFQKRR